MSEDKKIKGLINKLKDKQDYCKKKIESYNNEKPFQSNYTTSHSELMHWKDKEQIYDDIIKQLNVIKSSQHTPTCEFSYECQAYDREVCKTKESYLCFVKKEASDTGLKNKSFSLIELGRSKIKPETLTCDLCGELMNKQVRDFTDYFCSNKDCPCSQGEPSKTL